MNDYEKLLEEAYKKLPEKTIAKERFEPPVFDSFVHGSQTIVKNFQIVCDKIRRPKEMIIKYMSRELAAPVNSDGARMIINAKINYKILNEKLNEFIKNYVLCDQCGKPDTTLIEEHHILFIVCEACGSKKSVKKI